jgi:CTP:molybdopterin cytidylyltransferase MocA
MGRPKLILPIGGVTVIARVVTALLRGGAAPVVVVASPADAPGGSALAEEAARLGAQVVIPPGPTGDMRASIELGLDALGRAGAPEALLLAPGDSPGLSPDAVARLITRFGVDRPAIVVPTCAGRRGHPVLLRWDVARRIPSCRRASGSTRCGPPWPTGPSSWSAAIPRRWPTWTLPRITAAGRRRSDSGARTARRRGVSAAVRLPQFLRRSGVAAPSGRGELGLD